MTLKVMFWIVSHFNTSLMVISEDGHLIQQVKHFVLNAGRQSLP